MRPIPRLPNAPPMVDLSIIYDHWAHFQQYVIVEVTHVLAPFSCVDGYLQWFMRVSHPYAICSVNDE